MYPVADKAAFAAALLAHHDLRIRVEMLDLDHKPVATIGHRLLDGQVTVDSDGEVTRAANLTFSDPDRTLTFDSDSPSDGALYADRMLQVWYGVRTPGAAWREVPVFTGPVIKFVRNGHSVTVECQGKEIIAKTPLWRGIKFEKNQKKTDAIEEALRATGEKKFSFASMPGRLDKEKVVTSQEDVWSFARQTAKSLSGHLYYSGSGTLILTDPSNSSVWTFTGSMVKTAPQVSFLIDDVRNAVRVTGKKPQGRGRRGSESDQKRRAKVVAEAVAPNNHPLSPNRLGRGGKKRYLAEFIDDSKITTKKEAEKLAKATLDKRLLQVVEVAFDSLPVPHLEEGDVITLDVDGQVVRAKLTKFVIPLTAAGSMSVGQYRRVTRPRR